MASETEKLKLYMADPVEDADKTFNIDTMLNENWQKIDTTVTTVDDLEKVNKKFEEINDTIENIELTPGPPGPAGADGEPGPQGPKGEDGLVTKIKLNGTTYTHSEGTIELPDLATANHTHSEYAPKASPTFTGTPKAPAAATDYTTYRLRNMALMSSAPSSGVGNGQLVGVYK